MEKKISALPWKAEKWGDNADKFGGGFIDNIVSADITAYPVMRYSHVVDIKQRTMDADAIVSAVNNTYGAGIDPEAVPDMLVVLKEVSAWFNNGSDLSQQVDKIIEKAKLK